MAITCYFRHLTRIFAKAGINVTKENRKEIARIMQNLVGSVVDCPSVWLQIKKRLAEDEDRFVLELKTAWEGRITVK